MLPSPNPAAPNPANPTPARSTWIYLGLVLCGFGHAFALAYPKSHSEGGQWFLQLAALGLFFAVLRRAHSGKAVARMGLAFAMAWMLGVFYWLFVSINTYGGIAWPLALLAVLLFAFCLALFYLAASLLFHVLCRALPPILQALGFAACWTLAELARGTWFTGLPWGAAGYAHVGGPLEIYAPWMGVYGIGFLAALLAALLVGLLLDLLVTLSALFQAYFAPHIAPRFDRTKPNTPVPRNIYSTLAGLAAAAFLLLSSQMPISTFTQPTPPFSALLLQGNIAQDEKFIPSGGVQTALDWYAKALLDSKATLTITPETAIPILPTRLPSAYWESLVAKFTQDNQAAIIGMPVALHTERGTAYTNSAIALSPQHQGGNTYRYDKHHLVPFGELIPPFFQWFVDAMQMPLADFSAGSLTQPSLALANNRFGIHICYEDLFGEELAQRFAPNESAPTVLVNMSNIAWFGNTWALPQHLNISRMRALELQRPVLRATNTGATASIDHFGRVRAILPYLSRASLPAMVEGRTGLTPYTTWVLRFGLLPLWGLCLLVLVYCYWCQRRK